MYVFAMPRGVCSLSSSSSSTSAVPLAAFAVLMAQDVANTTGQRRRSRVPIVECVRAGVMILFIAPTLVVVQLLTQRIPRSLVDDAAISNP